MSPLVYEETDDKYRLRLAHRIATPIVGAAFRLDDCELSSDGVLTLLPGFRWDGASGPTIDTDDSQSPAAEHDAFYRSMRAGRLSRDYRPQVDAFFLRRLRECGMSRVRSWLWYVAVRMFAGSSARPSREHVHEAP